MTLEFRKTIFFFLVFLGSIGLVNAQIEKPKENPKSGGGTPTTSTKATVEVTWSGTGTVNIHFGEESITLASGETGLVVVKPATGLKVFVEYPNAEYPANEFIKFEKGKTFMNIWLVSGTVKWTKETEGDRNQRIAAEKAAEEEEERQAKAEEEQRKKDEVIRLENERLAKIAKQKAQNRSDSIARVEQAQRDKAEKERVARQAEIDRKHQALRDSLELNKKLNFAQEIATQMVNVKGGTFTMGATGDQGYGDPDAKKVRSVSVSTFEIGKFEVTQRLFKGIMGYNPSLHTQCEECPVENVSYVEVMDFISKLNEITGKSYRLPTEAEWEYSARGGSMTGKFRFAGAFVYSEVGWTKENSAGTSHQVGQKKANELGLFDMSGNVWEWCSDWYDPTYYSTGAYDNPKGASSGSYRVARGGSWFNPLAVARVSVREGANPSLKSGDGGFRLARTI